MIHSFKKEVLLSYCLDFISSDWFPNHTCAFANIDFNPGLRIKEQLFLVFQKFLASVEQERGPGKVKRLSGVWAPPTLGCFAHSDARETCCR